PAEAPVMTTTGGRATPGSRACPRINACSTRCLLPLTICPGPTDVTTRRFEAPSASLTRPRPLPMIRPRCGCALSQERAGSRRGDRMRRFILAVLVMLLAPPVALAEVRVFVTNEKSDDVTVIDAATRA